MQKYIQMVEKHAQLAKDASQFMWENPETGYREEGRHNHEVNFALGQSKSHRHDK